jgi:hephaestin
MPQHWEVAPSPSAWLPCAQNRTAEVAYLGNLGPIVRAAVGERILFHFCNKLAMPVSVHPHGVFYNKSSEGALYNDGTSG